MKQNGIAGVTGGKRLQFLDLAKGISITEVVLDYCMLHYDN